MYLFEVKFRYWGKATKLEKIRQNKVGDFFQFFAAFSDYLNFKYIIVFWYAK